PVTWYESLSHSGGRPGRCSSPAFPWAVPDLGMNRESGESQTDQWPAAPSPRTCFWPHLAPTVACTQNPPAPGAALLMAHVCRDRPSRLPRLVTAPLGGTATG